MTLLHLTCGQPMVQLTPLEHVEGVGDLPAPEKTTAWCPHCTAPQTSGHPAGGPTRADALVGSGSSTVAGTTQGAEEPWEGSADGFDRVKQSTGHRRPAEAGVR